MLTKTSFYFARHGQTDWNLAGRLQGQTDIPLNAVGQSQAEALAERAQGLGIETICASPLTRAQQTANAVSDFIGTPIITLNDLAECGWGEREGHTKGSWYSEWKAGRFHAERGETFESFLERALEGINQALALTGPVLIIAHGGLIWTLEKHTRIHFDRRVNNVDLLRFEAPLDPRSQWQVEWL